MWHESLDARCFFIERRGEFEYKDLRAEPPPDLSTTSFNLSRSSGDEISAASPAKKMIGVSFPLRVVYCEDFGQRHPERLILPDTIEQLTAYLTGKMPSSDFPKLGTQLIFGANEVAASYYLQRTLGSKNCDQDIAAHAAVLFPDQVKLQQLYIKSHLGAPPLSSVEISELYAARRHPTSTKDAQKLVQALQGCISSCANDRTKLALAIAQFINEDLAANQNNKPSLTELATMFGVNRSFIRAILNGEGGLLSKREAQQWQHEAALARDKENMNLIAMVARSLHGFVTMENELHRSGIIKNISSRDRLRRIFSLDNKELERCLKTLPSSEAEYRRWIFKGIERSNLQEEIVAIVRREMQISRESWGDTSVMRDDRSLAHSFRIQPVTVCRILAQFLLPEEREYRDAVMRGRSAQGPYRDSMREFIRAELEAFKKGEVSSLSSTAGISSIFATSLGTVREMLRQGDSGGFSAADRRLRAFVLLARPEMDAALRSMARMNMSELVEAVLARLIKEGALTSVSSLPAGEGKGRSAVDIITSRKRGSVCYKGHRFDSYEEAACAVLLEKYVRGFHPIEGKNFQVRADKYSLDFVIGDAVIEYHPIMLFRTRSGFGGFDSREEYKHYTDIKQTLSKEMRIRFMEETRLDLKRRYTEQRMSAIQQSPELRGKRLIVATDAESFYYLVIARFGGEQCPSKEQFIREFNLIKRQVRLHNQRRTIEVGNKKDGKEDFAR